MKIALLSAEYPPDPGGVGDYTRLLGQALLRRGHATYVFTSTETQFLLHDLRQADSSPVTLGQVPPGQQPWGWGCWPRVIAGLDAVRPDLLHLQYQTGAYGMHPAINLLPWRLRRLPNRPLLAATAHDLLLPYLFPKAGRLREWITWRLLADVDRAVVTNEQDQAQLARQRPTLQPTLIPIGSNITVAPPPGYDRAAWRAGLGVGPGETLVAFFGLISHSKGLDTLLAALAQLPPTTRLVLIGGQASGPEDRAYAAGVRRQIDELGLGWRVAITGHVAPADVSAHLLAADLAALPFVDGASFRRGSLLAALAHGLAVVTTAGGRETGDGRRETGDGRRETGDGRRETGEGEVLRLVDGVNVVLVAAGDGAGLARAIGRVAVDAELRARLGQAGRALAEQLSWEAIAARHEALYERMLAAGRE